MSLTRASVVMASLLCCQQTFAACKIQQLTEWHTRESATHPLVDGVLNNEHITISLDVGDYASFISKRLAEHFGLKLKGRSDRNLDEATEKIKRTWSTSIGELTVGPFSAKNVHIRVVEGNADDADPEADLILGADFFSQFVSEFDLAHDTVRVLVPQNCSPGDLAYWAPGYFIDDLDFNQTGNADYQTEYHTRIRVNGHSMESSFSNTTAASYLNYEDAINADATLSDTDPNNPSTEGRDLAIGKTWFGQLKSLAIGNETVQNPKLQVRNVFGRRFRWDNQLTSFRDEGIPALTLGADFFHAHRIVFMPEEHKMVFTYNGGPVFNATRPAETPSSTSSAPSSP